jgi:hypothetical protein
MAPWRPAGGLTRKGERRVHHWADHRVTRNTEKPTVLGTAGVVA